MDRKNFVDRTSLDQLRKQDELIDSTSHYKDSDYAGFLSIDNGINKFRIYPPHPSEQNHPFLQPRQVWMLPRMLYKQDENGNHLKDKKGNDILERKVKSVFDARIHSTKKVDIVDEYMKLLEKSYVELGLSTSEIKENMVLFYGDYKRKIFPIANKPEWIVYADKIMSNDTKKFGRLSFGKAVKKRINDIMAIEESNAPLGTESSNPFTHIDEGRLLIITYNKDATQASDYYQTDIDSDFDRKTRQIKFYPLSDNDLENFDKYMPLADQYFEKYTTKDMDLALEGLQIIDTENSFGIFESEKFLEKVKELYKLYPQPSEVEELEEVDDIEELEEVDETEEEIEEEEEADDSGLMKMNRTELKKYIQKNGLNIIIKTSYSEDEIRALIIEAESGVDELEEVEELEEVDEIEEKNDIKVSNASDIKSRIEEMRAKLGK